VSYQWPPARMVKEKHDHGLINCRILIAVASVANLSNKTIMHFLTNLSKKQLCILSLGCIYKEWGLVLFSNQSRPEFLLVSGWLQLFSSKLPFLKTQRTSKKLMVESEPKL
jgi:hypothetical protein